MRKITSIPEIPKGTSNNNYRRKNKKNIEKNRFQENKKGSAEIRNEKKQKSEINVFDYDKEIQ